LQTAPHAARECSHLRRGCARGPADPALCCGAFIGCLSAILLLVEPEAEAASCLLLAWGACTTLGLLPMLQSVLRDPVAVLRDPIITLGVSFLVYFVLGTLVVEFWQNSERVQQLLEFTGASPKSIFRASMAQGIGFGLAVASYGFCRAPGRSRVARMLSCKVVAVPRGKATWLFLAVGSVAQAVLFWCWLAGVSPPAAQSIAFLGNFMYAGLMLSAWESSALPRSGVSAVAMLLCLAQMGVGVIQLSKQTMLKPLLAILVGQHLRSRSIVSAITIVAVLATSFVLVVSRVGAAREVVNIDDTDLVARSSALTSGSPTSGGDTDPARAFVRLHYACTQAAIMDLYDTGHRGRDLELIPWLVVPRVLAPEKPAMTRGGQEVYTLLSGNEGSSDSPGVFTDGYFQLGWAGLLLAALAYGFVLAQFAAVADQMLRHNSWLLAPIVIFGHFTALRIDGHIVPDVLASGVLLYAALSLLAVVSFVVVPRTIVRSPAMPASAQPTAACLPPR
jgi:hypothetical protein